MRKLMRYGGIALAVAGIIGLIVVYLSIPKTAIVYFDNGTPTPVIACLLPRPQWFLPSASSLRAPEKKEKKSFKACEGTILGGIPPGTVLYTDLLRPGQNHVRFLSDDPNFQSIYTVDLPQNGINRKRRFIYNLRRSQHYAIYTMGYGASTITRPRIQELPDRTQFEITTALDFGQGLPTKMKVPKKIKATTMSITGHYPLHPDRECCRLLRESLTHVHDYQAPLVPPPRMSRRVAPRPIPVVPR